MGEQKMRLAIFPGSFDPPTNGHVDVIRRGAALFDRLIVAIGENPDKKALLAPDQRAAVLERIIADMPNVQVRTFQGLTVDFARKAGAAAILRGIRNSSDLQFEYQVALTNRVVAGVETVFIITSTQWAFTSSSLIRQVARMGGDVSAMVPPEAMEAIRGLQLTPPADTGLHETV